MNKKIIYMIEPTNPISVCKKLGNWATLQNNLESFATYSDEFYVLSSDINESVDSSRIKHIKCKNKNIFFRLLEYTLSPVLHKDVFKNSVLYVNHLAIVPAIISKILYGNRVVSRYSWRFYEAGKMEGNFKNTLFGWIAEELNLRFSDCILVTTDRLKDYVISKGIHSKKIKVIPEWINPSIFEYKEKKRDDVLNVISVGRLTPVKNHELLIKTLSILQKSIPCKLVIIGNGSLKANLERLAKELNVDLKIVIHVKNEDMPSYYHEHDIFVLCSKIEGCPRAVLEAMACGIPIIATNVEGINDVITDGYDGLLCNPDCLSLSQSILNLTKNDNLWKMLRENAHKTFLEKYEIKDNVQKLVSGIFSE